MPSLQSLRLNQCLLQLLHCRQILYRWVTGETRARVCLYKCCFLSTRKHLFARNESVCVSVSCCILMQMSKPASASTMISETGLKWAKKTLFLYGMTVYFRIDKCEKPWHKLATILSNLPLLSFPFLRKTNWLIQWEIRCACGINRVNSEWKHVGSVYLQLDLYCW